MSGYGYPFKIFVKEQNISEDILKPQENQHIPVQSLTGNSAREFYESIINETSTHKPETNKKRRIVRPVIKKSYSTINVSSSHIRKLAQNNEYVKLDRILTENKGRIDDQDDFGWTAIMCASYSGAYEAVEILIKHKANRDICDRFGYTAFKLAKKNNFSNIVELLKQNNLNVPHKTSKKKSVEPFFCHVCNDTFHADCHHHESSTLHQFNSNPVPTKTFYGIPDHNKGFQMLLKSGWNRGKGLGQNEHGVKFPVKVTKKNDRIGIGGSASKMYNEESGVHESHTMNKEEITTFCRREKCFERNFRLQFL